MITFHSEDHSASRSAEIMLSYLLGLDLPIPQVQECPYSQDVAGITFAVKVEDLTRGDSTKEEALRIHATRYDPSVLTMNEDYGIFQRKGTVGEILRKLIPVQKDGARSFSSLMFICWGQERFREALDTLFRLGVETIRSFKVQHGSSELFLGFIPNLKTPTVLSKFVFSSGIRVFYPVFSANYGVWMEWGWKCDFSAPIFYRVFQRSESETVFVLKEGNKIAIPAGISDFVPLLKFMELKYSIRSQTGQAEPREFKTPEFEYKLRLKRDSYRKYRKIELERLLQEEMEIREKIEWLRDIESVFQEETSYRAFFYPLSETVKDPIFPLEFIRHHSLSQLRKIKTFYGNLGTLSTGALVCGKDFIDRTPSAPFHISSRLYPRRGMVFQSNPHWMNKAGMRVMTPEGFDLFPYLEVDSDDRKAIVDTFLDNAVWGVTHDRMGAMKAMSDSSLRDLAEAVRQNPEKHIYFVFPRQDQHNPDWEDCPLEGAIIREEDFRDFDVKISNLGIHFAMDRSEREITEGEVHKTIVRNVTSRFDRCVSEIRDKVGESFQKERASIKEKIEAFDKDIEGKKEAVRTQGERIKELMDSAGKKEQLVVQYEKFLADVVSRYTSLVLRGAKDGGHFVSLIQIMLSEASKTFEAIVKESEQQTKDRLKAIEKTKTDVDEVAKKASDLLSKRAASFEAIEKLEDFQGKVLSEVKKENWNRLELRETIQDLWQIQTAFQGLESFLYQVENHVREAKGILRIEKTHAAAAAAQQRTTVSAGKLLDAAIAHLTKLKKNLDPDGLTEGGQPVHLPSQMEAHAHECLKVITESVDMIKKRRQWHKGKMLLHGSTLKYMEQLRARSSELLSKMN